MLQTVVGIYDDLSQARSVVEELIEIGFNRSDISLVATDRTSEHAGDIDIEESRKAEAGEGAAEGALAGGVFGGLTGVLVGMGLFAIPGIGPVVAAGPLAAGLVGAGVGAATGGLLGALLDWGIPEEEAAYYTEGVRRGSILVAVKATEDRVDEVVDVMESYDLVDLEERAEQWRQEGWTGFDYDLSSAARTGSFNTDDYALFEPTFRRHHNEHYEAGGYRYDEYEPAYRFGYELGGDSRYATVDWDDVEPEARRRWEMNHEGMWNQFKDAVRQGWQEVKETMDTDTPDLDYDEHGELEAYEDYEPTFRQHYTSRLATSGYPYDQYEPAYRYGYELGTDDRYGTADWEDLEPVARQRWETEQDGAWEQFKDAVRHAWEEVTGVFEEDEYEDFDEDEDEYRTTF